MPKPYISVIIPAYNEEKHIAKCLTALKYQQYNHSYEIIVVDNNSSDKTSAIARKFQVKVVKELKQNPAAARNAGAQIAKGNILAFTDADVIVPPNWLTSIGKAFQTQPHIVALVGTYQFKHTTKLLKFLNKLAFPTVDLIHKLLTGSFAFRGTNFAIKKQIFLKTGGFNSEFKALEDIELSSRVSQLGEIEYIPKLKVKTTDRRFRNRIKKYLEDFIPTYISVVILKKPHKNSYPEIR